MRDENGDLQSHEWGWTSLLVQWAAAFALWTGLGDHLQAGHQQAEGAEESVCGDTLSCICG